MFLIFIFQYEAAPGEVVAPQVAMTAEASPSDSLYGLGMAETAIEEGGVEWGQVALYTLSTVGIWIADGALSWAVHKMGQWLIRMELEGRATPWSRHALRALKVCPRWAFVAPSVRRSEVTIHQAKTFCDTMEEADRVFQARRRVVVEARPVTEDANVTTQDQEETFRPPVTSTEKKKVMIS